MRVQVPLALLVLLFAASVRAEGAPPADLTGVCAPHPSALAPVMSEHASSSVSPDFAGDWSTTYGALRFEQSGARATGRYDMEGTPGLIEGTVAGRRMTFTYREPGVAGEGWFDLAADGATFAGEWRAEGEERFSRWTGERAASNSAPGAPSFAGVWSTTFGPLRLRQSGKEVRGVYRMGDGRFAEVAGTAEGATLDFAYDECGVRGSGRFTLDPDGAAFTGDWKAEDGKGGGWAGARVAAKPGRIWLVVLEARWEDSLREREYAYGDMLAAYFARAQHVECRHRFFDDAASLKRACADIPFLPEPVVVSIASHGEEDGIVVGERKIGAAELADCFARADNIRLLHFSACLAMAGTLPAELAKRLPDGVAFPISGYATAVDWAGSAVAEFLYLELAVARGMEPAEAARRLVELLPLAGDRAAKDSPVPALGFRYAPAAKPAAKR